MGEVHGLSSEEERAEAVRRPFTIGTSTIEVGIDFKDEAEKDVLIYEARTAAQFIQRFGRLARHKKALNIPNHAIALVPEYVCHFLAEHLSEQQTISRHQLYQLIDDAYQRPEDFARYLQVHAAAEFHEARLSIQKLFQPDDRPRITEGLKGAIEALTGKTAKQVWSLHRTYKEERILQPLLTFRGSGFEAAILDERNSNIGFPFKRYDLMFLLRRGEIIELNQDAYLKLLDELAERWPEE
jgi:CRISPR/Cas system-associated endonuclease/helicase Cas3